MRVFTGKPTGDNATMSDLGIREIAVVVPLLVLSLFLGLHPSPVLDRIEPTVQQRVAFLEAKTDFREERPSGADRTAVEGLTFEQVAEQARKDAR